MLVAAALLWLGTACNLPGLPGGPDDAGADTGQPDAGRADGGEQICEPGRRCHITGVMICAPDGTDFDIINCADHEVCQRGRCTPIQNQCESALPFSLSTTRLDFSTGPKLRRDTEDFAVENCSDMEVSLWSVQVRGPNRPGGAGAWRLDEPTTLEKLLLGPGDRIESTVNFEPRYGFFREPGSLELEVRASDSRSYPTPIQLHPHIDCVTAPPRVDVGRVEVGQQVSVAVPFENCGTEDATVQLPGDGGLAGVGGWSIDSKEAAGENSLNLAAGGRGERVWVLEATEPGRLNMPLVFRSRRAGSSRRARKIVTRLVGRAVRAECVDGPTPPVPETRVGQRDWAARETVKARPFQAVDIRPPGEGVSGEAGGAMAVRLVERPDGSHAALEAHPATPSGSGGQSGSEGASKEASGWRLEPDVVGDYVLEVQGIREDGGLGCQTRRVVVDVRPGARLYVQLQWSAHQDAIPSDEGYGRGMDLNLHALPHDPPDSPEDPPQDPRDGVLAGDTLTAWQEPGADCFQRGLRAQKSCSRGQGRVVGVSGSGAGPEAIAFGAPGARDVAVAVHGWNSYHFPGATARLQVFVDGQPVLGEPVEGRFGVAPGVVWWVGTWDASEHRFVVADRFSKDFP